MSKLSFTDFMLPSADLGKLNPLPDLQQTVDAHALIPIDETTVTKEEAKYMGWGQINGILPYLIQDGYDRNKKMKSWQAAVLENDYIKATFMPEIGGRLWSLIDKRTGRELLQSNPVFQPCNLALRNAWVSGGVEWNIGIIGHSPHTVDPMFTEELQLNDGTPVLRMYQYERIRRLTYRIEAMLPQSSAYLFVRVRIDNATAEDTAVYWWSNIAVDERDDVRVLVPADKSYRWGYGGNLSKITIPYVTVKAEDLSGENKQEGSLDWDISRSTKLPQAMDFFFDIPAGQRRWISALDAAGYGLVQTSTDNLIGRKLFVWGMGAGGRNWQTFLSQEGEAYIELQAGLASTQLEHLPMAGNETISWMEAYGPITADGTIVQGQNWQAAYREVAKRLELACPSELLVQMHEKAKSELDGRKGSSKLLGQGWPLVEKELLGAAFTTSGLDFPAKSIGPGEKPWLDLVRSGALPCPAVLDEPTSYQVGQHWLELLANSIAKGKSNHWYGYYQLGVMLAHSGQAEQAIAAFDKSIELAKNPWALRSKAVLLDLAGVEDQAADLLLAAVNMLAEPNLAKEALVALQKAGRPEQVIELYGRLPLDIQKLGRLKVGLIEALLDIADADGAEKILNQDIVLTDVREGEVKLTDLWFRMKAMQEAKKTGVAYSEKLLARLKKEAVPPTHLDFRMH